MKQPQRPLTLEERKSIQLEMLKEIDAFCRANDIKYSLAFGTLLGAIRHKGFIPWDDDVDIMMPLPELLRFKEIFKSSNIEYHDVDNNKYHSFPFSRLVYKSTYSKNGKYFHGDGICVDLYICLGIPDKSKEYIDGAYPLYEKRIKMMKNRNRVINYIPIKTIPFFSMIQKQYRNYLFEKSIPYKTAHYFYMIAGPLSEWELMCYDYDVFDDLMESKFENLNCLITSHYDKFLNQRYGDYMTPPPVDEQKPAHGGDYYWKNK